MTDQSLSSLVSSSAEHFFPRAPSPGQTLAQLHAEQAAYKDTQAPYVLYKCIADNPSLFREVITIFDSQITSSSRVEDRLALFRAFSTLVSDLANKYTACVDAASLSIGLKCTTLPLLSAPWSTGETVRVLHLALTHIEDVALARYTLDVILTAVRVALNAHSTVLSSPSGEDAVAETDIAASKHTLCPRTEDGEPLFADSRAPAWSLFHMIANSLTIPALPQPARKAFFDLTALLLHARERQLVAAGRRVLVQWLGAVDAEKDPRNLLVVFTVWAELLARTHPAVLLPHVVEVFEATSCYFPITFTSVKHDGLTVTGPQLQAALTAAIAASPLLAPYALPFLLEKGSAEALESLRVCVSQWGGDALVALAYEDMMERIVMGVGELPEPAATPTSEQKQSDCCRGAAATAADSAQSSGCCGGRDKAAAVEPPASTGCCGGAKAKPAGGCCSAPTQSLPRHSALDIDSLLALAHVSAAPTDPLADLYNRAFAEEERPEPTHLAEMWSDLKRIATTSGTQAVVDAAIAVCVAVTRALCPDHIATPTTLHTSPPLRVYGRERALVLSAATQAYCAHVKPLPGAASFVQPLVAAATQELTVPDAKQARAHTRILTECLAASRTAATCAAPQLWRALHDRLTRPTMPLTARAALVAVAADACDAVSRAVARAALEDSQFSSAADMNDSDAACTDVAGSAWERSLPPAQRAHWHAVCAELEMLFRAEDGDVPLALDAALDTLLHPLQRVGACAAATLRRQWAHIWPAFSAFLAQERVDMNEDVPEVGSARDVLDTTLECLRLCRVLLSAVPAAIYLPHPRAPVATVCSAEGCPLLDTPVANRLALLALGPALALKLPLAFSLASPTAFPPLAPLNIAMPASLAGAAVAALSSLPPLLARNLALFLAHAIPASVQSHAPTAPVIYRQTLALARVLSVAELDPVVAALAQVATTALTATATAVPNSPPPAVLNGALSVLADLLQRAQQTAYASALTLLPDVRNNLFPTLLHTLAHARVTTVSIEPAAPVLTLTRTTTSLPARTVEACVTLAQALLRALPTEARTRALAQIVAEVAAHDVLQGDLLPPLAQLTDANRNMHEDAATADVHAVLLTPRVCSLPPALLALLALSLAAAHEPLRESDMPQLRTLLAALMQFALSAPQEALLVPDAHATEDTAANATLSPAILARHCVTNILLLLPEGHDLLAALATHVLPALAQRITAPAFATPESPRAQLLIAHARQAALALYAALARVLVLRLDTVPVAAVAAGVLSLCDAAQALQLDDELVQQLTMVVSVLHSDRFDALSAAGFVSLSTVTAEAAEPHHPRVMPMLLVAPPHQHTYFSAVLEQLLHWNCPLAPLSLAHLTLDSTLASLLPALPALLQPLLNALSSSVAAVPPIALAALQRLLSLHRIPQSACVEAFTAALALLLPAADTFLPALAALVAPAAAPRDSTLFAVLDVMCTLALRTPSAQVALLLPHRARMLAVCQPALGHGKRAIRMAAVRAKNTWEALK